MKHSSLLAACLTAALPARLALQSQAKESLVDIPVTEETITERLNKAEKKRLKRQNRNMLNKLGETK
jgi:hypothetical protein